MDKKRSLKQTACIKIDPPAKILPTRLSERQRSKLRSFETLEGDEDYGSRM